MQYDQVQIKWVQLMTRKLVKTRNYDAIAIKLYPYNIIFTNKKQFLNNISITVLTAKLN